MNDNNRENISSLTLPDFTASISESSPAPGGGGAAAAVGAIGVSLGAMVGSLTVGKKKYADVEDKMQSLISEAGRLRLELLSLIDEDAVAFTPLAKAYGIPKDDPSRDKIMEEALQSACAVPLEIMKKSAEALLLIKDFAEYGSRLAISDAGCAACAIRAALCAASLNVSVNTRLMKDQKTAERFDKEAGDLLSSNLPLADEIYNSVSEKLKALPL